jgi:hypothetical protein
MKNKLFAFALVAPLLFGAVACSGWFAVDGSYHARYVGRPAYEGHARYRYGNYSVYEVNGEYYREHEGRWIQYRERPRELVVWQ